MPRATLLMAAASLAACAEPGPKGSESNANEIAATGTLAAEEDGTTPGAWQSAGEDDSQAVLFRSPDGEPLFSVGCDLRGGLLFQRHGFVARANLAMMQLRTGGAVRRLAATTGADGQPHVQARAPYSDQLIPALMRFAKPLEVRFEGLETLILPPSPAVRELAQRCQSGERPAAAPAAAGEVEPG